MLKILFKIIMRFITVLIIIEVLTFFYPNLNPNYADVVVTGIENYLDANPDVDIIRLEDFTTRSWDSVLIYTFHASEREIRETTKLPFPLNISLRPGFVLYRGKRMVFYEKGWSDATDVPFRTSIVPYYDDDEEREFRLLTKEEAVFYVIRNPRGGDSEDGYILYPYADVVAAGAAG